MASALDTIKTPAQLAQEAQQQAIAEVGGQTAPLTAQIGAEQRRETGALQQIGTLFQGLQPTVDQNANAVQSSYDAANTSSQAIFAAAQQRMDQLRQDRAAEAQALAQKMGGPVAVGEFTDSVDPSRNQLASVAPNQMLWGLGEAQAGVQAARSFSGKVFPAMATEQAATARSFYEGKIQDIQDEITKLESTKGSLASSKLNDLIKQEREYELQLHQSQLDKTKADRDWKATQHQLRNDDARLNLTKKQFGLQESGVTGKYKGKATLAAVKISADEKLAASKLGLSVAQYKEMVRHHLESEKVQARRATNQAQTKAMSILDAVTGGSKAGTITQKQWMTDTAGSAAMLSGKTNVFKDPKTGKYYTYVTNHLTAHELQRKYGSGYANDPQQLYDLLTGSNIPKQMALKLVRAKTGVGDFQPGKPVVYSHNDLVAVGKRSFNELRGLALARGFKPNKNHPANSQMLIDYIMHNNPVA